MKTTLGLKPIASGILCPVCDAELTGPRCGACGQDYVMLGDILCLSPVGAAQLNLWRHQLHTLQQASETTLDYYIDQLAAADLLPATQKRLEERLESTVQIRDFMLGLFDRVGITPQYDPALEGAPVGILGEYYCHIARDWAWQHAESGSYVEQLRTLLDSWPHKDAGRVLVLGSGPGRVAWDLHCTLGNVETVTLDLNPALQLVANQLIQGQPLPPFPETPVSPQMAVDTHFMSWTLDPSPLGHSGALNRFHQLVGDIWQLQFAPGAFDFIVTSWFVDAHGRDNREFIGLISQWLKPGGYWINTGPLLYPDPLAPAFKCNHQEYKDLLQLARFRIQHETATVQAHLPSPLSVKKQYEEIWTFCAQYTPSQRASAIMGKPDWLILHYLPVVKAECAPADGNPVIEAILELVDGARSINAIVAIMEPNLPSDVDVRRAVVSVFAEMLPDLI